MKALSFMKRKDTDMTTGVIWKQLLMFALPLMIGNLFQQLYNTVDSIVVGNFVGKEALAAVGSVGSIINTLIGFFTGLAAGAGVAISQAYGAKDEAKVHDAVHTSLFLTLIMSIIITIVGVAFVPLMLHLMSTPEDVMPGATIYLRIYFAGSVGLLFYNMGAGILRAVGDSTRPLYFLIFSAITNTILDLVFVIVFHLGIAGVALATVAAQILSALLCMRTLMKATGSYKVILSHIRPNGAVMKRILQLGIPTAIQMAVTAFSNVFVQGYINHFGSATMAGYSSYSKLDQFIILPMQGIALSATTFAGQNFGAGQMKRTRKGTFTAWIMGEICTLVLMIPVIIFAPFMVQLFNSDPEVIRKGVVFIYWMTPFYVLCVTNQIYAGTLRGCGDTTTPMLIMLGSFVVFRQIYLFIISRICNTEILIALGYPFGWILCSSIVLLYYKFGKWEARCKKRAMMRKQA